MGSAPSEPYGAPRKPWGRGGPAGAVPHQGGGMRIQTVPHQWWQSAARPLHPGLCSHPHTKPAPARVPQLRGAPAPTSPATAPLPPAREGPMFPGSVVAMRRRLPGTSQGERGVGRTPSKHGVRGHHPWVPEGLVHLMSAGTRDFAGDLPHPLCSKQPLSCTQGTAGVLGAGNPRGQCVVPGMTGTEMPPGHEATLQTGTAGSTEGSWGECCTLPLPFKALLSSFSAHNSFPVTAAGLLAG